jgi:hypothetical protein
MFLFWAKIRMEIGVDQPFSKIYNTPLVEGKMSRDFRSR